MKIQESGENYLEAILLLSQKKAEVHAVDVSDYLAFSKPSVSRAVKILTAAGLINVDSSGALRFTDEGRRRAERTLERHRVLTSALTALGVDAAVAEQDACRAEHVISEETFEAIRKHLGKN